MRRLVLLICSTAERSAEVNVAATERASPIR